MGRKTHPVGFRLGISKDWQSRWYSKKNYSENALTEVRIRRYIKSQGRSAGIHKIQIDRSLSSLKLTITVSRPGVIIGRGGENLKKLRKGLLDIVPDKVDLVIEEFKVPELSAALVSQNVASQIERRLPIRRVMSFTSERVMERGAKGVKIVCSGVLSGPSSISRSQKVVKGLVPTQRLRADLDFAKETAFTSYGTVGVKVWIYLGDKEI